MPSPLNPPKPPKRVRAANSRAKASISLAPVSPDRTDHALAVILGDQLDHQNPLLTHLKLTPHTILMVEALEESQHVPSHRQRTILFLSAMRHYAAWLRAQGFTVRYITLEDPANSQSLAGELRRAITALKPTKLIMVEPGEHRLAAEFTALAEEVNLPITFFEDTHFLTTHAQFEQWAKGRRALTMEYFYREQRRRLGILVDTDQQPEGGDWNYDADNRSSFPRSGPSPRPKPPLRFPPDQLTKSVIASVASLLPKAPGSDASFSWAVTREQALQALDDFVKHRLDLFGPYEDAMWTDEPVVYHSTLSSALNLKLLNPRECIDAALTALKKGKARLQSVEAFIRQLIGWREYIRGVYFLEGAQYSERNYLHQHGALPEFYWNAQTDMKCMSECLGQVVQNAFGHHIQRLMVTGNFALISGIHPKAISDWYLSMYVDAVDWVTLPNTLGMVMHADGTDTKGPVVGTKPYCASGQYIKRMSNYCSQCKYNPAIRVGPSACPFTTFYWDFLNRHRATFERNPRMGTIIRNIDRFGPEHMQQITISATALRTKFKIGDITKGSAPTAAAYASADYSLTIHSAHNTIGASLTDQSAAAKPPRGSLFT